MTASSEPSPGRRALPSPLRMAALVVLVALLAAVVLARTAPAPPDPSAAAITSLAVPAQAYPGEVLSIRGSIWLPDERTLDRRFRVCEVATALCWGSGWGTVSGPGAWIGYAGGFTAARTGTFELSWTLHADWGADAGRAVVRYQTEVTVVAAPE